MVQQHGFAGAEDVGKIPVIREKKEFPQKKFNKDSKQFLQSLALIFVCTIFILLILSAGLMDLRRLDNTLIGFMQNRGSDIIGNVQRAAQASYSNLMQLLSGEHSGTTISPFTDETFLPQESLIKALIALSSRIDQLWDGNRLQPSEKDRYADREGLWILAVIDSKGKITFQNRPVPINLLNRAAPVISGKNNISIDLFKRSGKADMNGFICVRRTAGSGAILIALDDAGFQFWGTRVAVQRAIEEAGWGKGVAYICIMNRKGLILGSAGDLNEKWKEEAFQNLDSLKGKPELYHRKISFHEKDILEIIGPLVLDGKVVGIARIGLERDRTDAIVRENRYNMFISMAAIILIRSPVHLVFIPKPEPAS